MCSYNNLLKDHAEGKYDKALAALYALDGRQYCL